MEGKKYLLFPLTCTKTPGATLGAGGCSWQMTSSPTPQRNTVSFGCSPHWHAGAAELNGLRIPTADAQRSKSWLVGQPPWAVLAPGDGECRAQCAGALGQCWETLLPRILPVTEPQCPHPQQLSWRLLWGAKEVLKP